MLKSFRKGGVHPPENKHTELAITDAPLPREVTLLLNQHIGVPAKPTVAKGDSVKRGDLVAAAGGFMSANIHTPISGTVTKIDKSKNAQGIACDAITIAATDADHDHDIELMSSPDQPIRNEAELSALTPKEIVDIIDSAGIVGLGGAAFPTKVKLCPPPGNKADVLIINAAECEPYLTCDAALMCEKPNEIIAGVQFLMRAATVDKAFIGIEANKPRAIEALTQAALSDPHITVVTLKVKYPQGGEKQLIEALIGKEVASGALPISTGAIVQNVATAYAVYEAVVYGKPLIERVVTITGDCHQTGHGNYRAAIGYNLSQLIDLAGGLSENVKKLVLGGPMMGRTACLLDSPTVKGTSGILMLSATDTRRRKVEPCIRCAMCVNACPMGLEPYLLATMSHLNDWAQVESQKVMNCIECGCCSYTCPSNRPLLDFIRYGKSTVGGIIRSRQQK